MVVPSGELVDFPDAQLIAPTALCAEIYSQSTPAPYDIFHGDQLVDETLIRELATEIARIASPGSDLWADERYRNLYLLLQRGARKQFPYLGVVQLGT